MKAAVSAVRARYIFIEFIDLFSVLEQQTTRNATDVKSK